MSESAPSDDFDVNEAAANARKLALSTNSSVPWQGSYCFDIYSQIPPPNIYQNFQPGGGMNFMTGSNSTFAPPPIPQLSIPPPSPRSGVRRHLLPPPHPQLPYHPPPPFYNNYPPPNYLPGNQRNSLWDGNSVEDAEIVEVVERVARNPEMNGPKPIRFSLNAIGRKHVFSKPVPNNYSGVYNKSRGGGFGNKSNSRFGPPLNPLEGMVNVIPDPYSAQIETAKASGGLSPKKIDTSNYGLSNGSTWASPTSNGISAASNVTSSVSIGAGSTPQSQIKLIDKDFAACINSENWPASLKAYAEKWFTIVLSTNPDQIDKAQDLLRQKLEESYRAGNFSGKDWSQEQLPFLPPSQSVKNGFNAAPIPGIVKGTPLKTDVFTPGGRGRGRGGGRGGRNSPNPSESFKSRHGRPKGIRGRNRFKSGSTSRSRSRSRSNSSSSSDSRSKKRRRSSSGNKYSKKRSERKYGKKERGKNKKLNAKEKKATAHIYSEFGTVGGGIADEASKARLNARAARFAKDDRKPSPKRSLKSRLGGFVNNAKLLEPAPIVKWGIDTTPSNYNRNGRKGVMISLDMHSSIIGTATNLEKMYLRLTTAPDPLAIRPVHILKESLKMVREKWQKNEDYRYTCDQLKSIRQDLTVQRVREPFTILVYETHARIALERGDHEEFNQCQSQLVQLYDTVRDGKENQLEFTAYRILYYIFTSSTYDLWTVMKSLSETDMQDECISHALYVRSAWSIGNHYQFFKLHKVSPKMSGYLIDWFVNRERKKALRKLIKSYRPVVPKSFLLNQLDLTEEGWQSFIKATQLEAAIIYSDVPANTKIDARASQAALVAVLGA